MTIDNYSASCDCSGAAEFVKPATEEDSSDAVCEDGNGKRKKCLAIDGCTFDADSKICSPGGNDGQSCDQVTKKKTCQGRDDCLWLGGKNGECFAMADGCSSLDRKGCNKQSACKWARRKKQCRAA